MPLLFLSQSAYIHPPKPKHMSISMRSINQIGLWGPICQKLFHWLNPNPAGSPAADWEAQNDLASSRLRPATRGLHLKKKPRERSPPKHGQVTSRFQKFHLPKAFLKFPLTGTTDFQSSKKKKKKASEMVSNHSKIKTWWQQSRAKCYHLLISWSCHYHPPLKLSPVSLCQMTKHCAEPESLLLHLQTTAQGENRSKENEPARPHSTPELSVSEVWLFSSVEPEIHLVHRAHPVLGAPSRTTGVRLQVFTQTHMQRPVLCSLDGH